MSKFAPRRTALGAWVVSPFGARKFASDAPTVESRELYTFEAFDDGGGQLGATLKVHGDEVDNMDEITRLLAWEDGSDSTFITVLDSIAFDSDTDPAFPLGLTVLEFSGGSTWGSETFTRFQVERATVRGEHWLVDGTQLLWGEINLTSSAQIGMGSTALCAGGSHTHALGDIQHQWTWSPAGALSDAQRNQFMGGAVLSRWVTPSSSYDFTGTEVCVADSVKYDEVGGSFHNIAGAGFVAIEPGGAALVTGFAIGVPPPFAWSEAPAFQ